MSRRLYVATVCYGLFGYGYIIPATFLPALARGHIDDPVMFGWIWPLFGTAAALSPADGRRFIPTHTRCAYRSLLGTPGILCGRHTTSARKVMIQATTVAQAIEVAERGADVIIAQGGEARRYGGAVSTMVLLPQVVDAVSPILVVAPGGIFDGRGIAAAFMLGSVGVNIGTRFLASREAPIKDSWKVAIVAARSEDAVPVEVLNDIHPLPGTGGYGTVLRSLRTPFIDELGAKREEARRECGRLWPEFQARIRAGRRNETLLTAAQTSGGIKEILPVAEPVRQRTAEAVVTFVKVGLMQTERNNRRN